MKCLTLILPVFLAIAPVRAQVADTATYLADIRLELTKQWPANRTINIVFHGHSVPAGYFKTPEVRTLDAYPHLALKLLKETYPFASLNIIITSIGGENSSQGAKRFDSDVLIHKPDIVLIDYSLNDRWTSLKDTRTAWESMIRKALEMHVKVILLTPSPDLGENILDPAAPLAAYAGLVRDLAAQYKTGLADSYAVFSRLAASGEKLEGYMSQGNHPNEKGHLLIAREIVRYLR